MSLFQHAQFLTTVNHLRDLPHHGGLEVAFVGRSNAGKSSAINALSNRTRLAFVSKTPGRTQHINFFDLGSQRYLVDLPGYGYAAVPAKIRQHWEGLLSPYLQTRSELAGLVIIMDVRHPLKETDCHMLEWFAPTGRPVHILLTKADKLSTLQAQRTLKQVNTELVQHYPFASAQLFSSLKRQGIAETEAKLQQWFTL